MYIIIYIYIYVYYHIYIYIHCETHASSTCHPLLVVQPSLRCLPRIHIHPQPGELAQRARRAGWGFSHFALRCRSRSFGGKRKLATQGVIWPAGLVRLLVVEGRYQFETGSGAWNVWIQRIRCRSGVNATSGASSYVRSFDGQRWNLVEQSGVVAPCMASGQDRGVGDATHFGLQRYSISNASASSEGAVSEWHGFCEESGGASGRNVGSNPFGEEVWVGGEGTV